MIHKNFLALKTPRIFAFIITSLFTLSLRAEPSDNFMLFDDNEIYEESALPQKSFSRQWTFIVYIAADNDLRSFAANNIKQMAQLGSNDNINIAVQLDIRITGNQKITRRYFIDKNKIYHLNINEASTQRMDSGDPKSLVSCACWAIQNYPASKYALILWNHGTGIIDPGYSRIINASELFSYNATLHTLELDRSIGFLDYMNKVKESDSTRGICWDDSTGNYLTNKKLDSALQEICTRLLYGKKLNIIGFDACLMSMLEVASLVKKYANIMVASQEVELGTSWDYAKVLAPFAYRALSETAFAQHIVDSYGKVYSRITNDYTLSAINLNAIDSLENNVNTLAAILLDCLKKQKNNTVKNTILASCSKDDCTNFEEPSFIDLHHFYCNLQDNLGDFEFNSDAEGMLYRTQLNATLQEGKALITKIAFANVAGNNLKAAKGISIYFPEKNIHYSYKQSNFAYTNKWYTFLTKMVG